MGRLRGWALLLAIFTPLLILFSWNRLGSEASRVQVERFGEWAPIHLTPELLRPLDEHFRKHKTLAGPGDVALPPVPRESGVRAWTLQPDHVLRVEFDGKEKGRPVVLRWVPVLKSANGVFYDCVSANSQGLVGRVCRSEFLRSDADIPAQLEANVRFLQNLPAAVNAAGTTLRAGAIGSVVAVPTRREELDRCGYQCVKLQSCVTPRPLACGRPMRQGNTSWYEIAPTRDDFRGNSFATREDADRACEQSQGEGSRVVRAPGISGAETLVGGNEYWVHDEMRPENNCWRAGPR